jgi:hypothetical protein
MTTTKPTRNEGARIEVREAKDGDKTTAPRQANGHDPHPALPPGVKRTWVCAADIVSEPLDWLWKGWLARGKLTLMAGDPGGGKSAVAIDIAARVTTGRGMPNEPASARHDPHGVVIISFEDNEADTIKPRLRAAGADMRRVAVFPLEAAPSVTRALRAITAAVEEYHAALLILDPLGSAVQGGVDGHRDMAVREALTPFIRALSAWRVACLAPYHLNKSDGKGVKALYRIMGSQAFGGLARFAFVVGHDPAQPANPYAHVIAPVKTNLTTRAAALCYRTDEIDLPAEGREPALKEVVRVVWTGTSTATADEVLAPPASREAREKIEHAAALLGQLLSDGGEDGVRVSELEAVRKAHGISDHAWREARVRVGAEVVRVGFGKGSYVVWKLGPDIVDEVVVNG